MIDGAAPVAAQHAGSMRIVDHHDGAVFFGEIAQRGQRADIAVHGEDAVGDQQLLAGLVLDAGQLLFGVRDVFVAEDENLRLREARAVDDRGVVQRVGDDEVVFAQHRRNRSRIGREAGLEDHAGLDVLEARDLLFQLHVDLHGAGDGAHRARSHAVFARGFERGLAQLGMRGQSEIIVRGEVDDFLAVEGADGRLLVVEHAQLEVRALGLEFVELVGEIGERIGAGCGGHGDPLNFFATDLRGSTRIK